MSTHDHEQQLLTLLQQHTSLGNGKARELLGWDEATYDEVKGSLVAQGQVAIGRGRGGSISLVAAGQEAPEPKGQTANGLPATMPPPVPYPTAMRGPGRPPKAPKPEAKSPMAPEPIVSKAPKPKADAIIDPTHLTLAQLENHLWASANILRGPVDAADFKTYIFPLLFFKRISDVRDEEYQAALAEGAGDEEYASFPQHYRFQVPADCHWEDVRATATNVGQRLQKALRGIEQANPDTLYGIFGDAQWTNKERLSDALLRDLIEHFSRIPLGNAVAKNDILGQSYEYLIKKFADATNKKAGEFYTPRSVVRLMVNILDPQEGESIYDPACGTGGMLMEAIQHVSEQHGDARTLWGKLYGQERNLTTSAIARMNLFLHGASDFRIVRGDTLRDPAFYSGGSLATFDCVIANPPFSLKKWGEELWTSDPWGRNFAGMPPDKSGDYAWVQHMLKSMAPGSGRMAVVLPHGALFRGGKEGEIRKKILHMDLLEAVIGLGPNLFYGTGLAACILVFRQKKAKDRRNKVLILDASREFKTGRAQNELLPQHVDRIFQWYRDYTDVEGIAKVVTLDEIAANDHNLNIPRYVEPPVQQQVLSVDEAMAQLKASAAKAFEAEERLVGLMKKEGILVEQQ
jgi:type I restriction enzyme M protein